MAARGGSRRYAGRIEIRRIEMKQIARTHAQQLRSFFWCLGITLMTIAWATVSVAQSIETTTPAEASSKASRARSYHVLYTFRGGADGGSPSGLILDSAGNLYGTAGGGDFDDGMVFKVSKTGKKSVLHSFNGMDGDGPYGGVIQDEAGNLYGTTSGGLAYSQGVVYKLDRTGKETVLYRFTGGVDGGLSLAGLIRDSAGRLYGTTNIGGAFDNGTVFKVSTTSKEAVLHSFDGGTADGDFPVAALIRDAAGNLYSTTYSGGNTRFCAPYGCGTVFKVDKNGKETVLHDFKGGSDGANPSAVLLRDGAGNLYGTTFAGGGSGCTGIGCGTVFKLDPAGKETVLHRFTDGADGSAPYAGLILDAAGNLYGTASAGGLGGGVVFKLDRAGKETVLHNFGGSGDGYFPLATLTRDSAGNLYGTTANGGDPFCICGVVFKLTP
jgi:uncharacterized repeat protein (TIGR03803 family)